MKRKKLCLEIELKDEIVEGRPEHSVFSRRVKTSLHYLLEVLKRAAENPRVAALLLTVDRLDAGWARLCSIRRALLRFRASGKFACCYMPSAGNGEYFLATACDALYMAPAGSLNLVGLAGEVFFLRELLGRFGLKAELHSVGEFKSAAEMFTRTSMSPEARLQLEELLDDFVDEFHSALASGRSMEKDKVRELIDAGPYSAREAVSARLIEGICYRDELEAKLEEKVGCPLRLVPPPRIFKGEGFIRRLLTCRRPRIAVIDVVGQIVTGESRRDRAGRHLAGSETIGQFLDHARKSKRVRAVVLRVDSPGGTGEASDEIWRKVALVKKAKPIVASLGDVAASGGYYISVPASRIIAEPTTITGSIGVLGGKFVAQELMTRLLVRREVISRGLHAEFDSLFSPFSSAELENLRRHLEEFYREDFLKKVADGRSLPEDAVDRAGRGRVWTARRAAGLGLLDELGGPMEACNEARQLAGIPEKGKIRIVHYHRRPRLRDLLTPEFASPFRLAEPAPQVRESLELLSLVRGVSVLLWMPFKIRIR
ncbi:MAG: S49 family peptidase [Acidobacteria bacterium]|nr:S49 family peptidase [Acidobacteriota bacterium]